MSGHQHDSITSEFCGAECKSLGRGHHMHWIHVGLLGKMPWGWRDGVVEAVTEDGHITIRYLEEGAITVWHHHQLGLRAGDAVRVFEGEPAIGTPSGWFHVKVTGGGLGPVPEPADKSLWTRETTAGIVNMQTGVALPTDYADLLGQRGQGSHERHD